VSRLEKVGVRASDQILETVGRPGLGKTKRDRVVRIGRCQHCGDLLEACPCLAHAEIRHRAEQLVAAVAHDHIVGTDIRAKGLAEEPQQRVARQMTLIVVDLFEAVDVDESKHEPGARAVRTLELTRQFLKTKLSRPRARQFVRRRELQVVCRSRAVPTRLGAFTGCLLPIGGRPCPVVGGLGAIGSSPCPIALGAQKNVLPTRVRVVLQIVQTSQRITTFRATITKLGGPITLRPRSQPRRGTLSAHHRHGVTVPTRPLPRQSASVVCDRVATRREIIVGGVLILICASLITLTRRLIVIRPRLILITRRLVAITRPLVAIGQRTVTHRISRTGLQLGAAGRAPRNRCRFAAGWTLHNLRHDPPIPERPPGEIPMVAA
jgi:hypothetical protein